MNMQIIILCLATMSTGLMAGIFFTWTNAVTPGIGKLNDIEYLSALQSMNRVILNPVFYALFWGPVLTLPFSVVLSYYSGLAIVFKLLLVACIIYLSGSFLVTLLGNIPLNHLLDKHDLENFSAEEARNLREKIEVKWNTFNLIRTLTSSFAFILLVIICLLITI